MAIFGAKTKFAIEMEITDTATGDCSEWIFGHLRFWFYNAECGNWTDSTALSVCHGWLKEFGEKPKDRYEEGLLAISPAVIFEKLVEPIWPGNHDTNIPEPYKNTLDRFHIHHLGMSSFDNVRMVLIEDAEVQRCIWQSGDSRDLHDNKFPSGQMQSVARECSNYLEKQAKALGIKLNREK